MRKKTLIITGIIAFSTITIVVILAYVIKNENVDDTATKELLYNITEDILIENRTEDYICTKYESEMYNIPLRSCNTLYKGIETLERSIPEDSDYTIEIRFHNEEEDYNVYIIYLVSGSKKVGLPIETIK